MAHEEHHLSPDGLLHLKVVFADDGDIIIGFDGFEWHTHGELLIDRYGSTSEESAQAFVQSIISGVEVIELVLESDRLLDASILDTLWPCTPALPGQSVLLRYWDGTLHTPPN